MSKIYEVSISTDGDNTQTDIQQALTNEVSRQATIAQQEYLAALVGGVAVESCKNVKEDDCDCDEDDDEDDDLDEATSPKRKVKQFTDLSAFKTFIASYQKNVDGVEVKRQQLVGNWKWFAYEGTDIIGTFDEESGKGYVTILLGAG